MNKNGPACSRKNSKCWEVNLNISDGSIVFEWKNIGTQAGKYEYEFWIMPKFPNLGPNTEYQNDILLNVNKMHKVATGMVLLSVEFRLDTFFSFFFIVIAKTKV